MRDFQEFIEHDKGNFPLVISVPHGGEIDCKLLPKRRSGILGIDKGTIDLARDLFKYLSTQSTLSEQVSIKPSYVISKLRRNKIDFNRPESEAFPLGSELSKQFYHYYHEKIRNYVDYNIKKYNISLLVDIHGFERHKRPPGFRDVDLIIGTENLKSLYSRPISKNNWHETLRGKLVEKFITLMIPIAPGHPNRKEYVLTGGYITSSYGASQIPKSQAMQIEFSERIRLKDVQLKKKVLKNIACLLIDEIRPQILLDENID